MPPGMPHPPPPHSPEPEEAVCDVVETAAHPEPLPEEVPYSDAAPYVEPPTSTDEVTNSSLPQEESQFVEQAATFIDQPAEEATPDHFANGSLPSSDATGPAQQGKVAAQEQGGGEASSQIEASSGPAPAAENIQTEVLPAETAEDKSKGITLLFMRALGKKAQENEQRTLAHRPAAGVSPSLQGAAPPRRPGFWRRHGLFFATVVLPTLLSVLYFALYATKIYVSESSYVVRSPNKQSTAASGLGSLLQGAGFSGFAKAPDDVYAVSQYIQSRDALSFLDEKLDLRTEWQSDKIDLLHRFDPLDLDDSREALHEYYLKMVKVGAEPASGITTLTVMGFSPEQVLVTNELLLGKAEELVNILNERGRNDLIRFAGTEVKHAEDKAKAAAKALSDFRNTQAVVDPEKQTMLHFEQISRLQEELIRTRGQLTQLKVFAPDSPHPPALELRTRTLEAEIATETEKITGGEQSLASKAAEYQRLQLERDFADKQLAVAMAALESARNEAQRQQLYLETIAKPSLPDDAAYPKRIRGVLTTLVLGLVAWGILAMLLAGVREHQY